MTHFIVAFKTVLPLFLVIFTGALFSRTKVASKDWVEILNQYALYIGFPALVIASLMNLEVNGNSYPTLILVNSGYIIFCLLLAVPIARIFNLSLEMKRTLFLVLPFGNVAYLGIPVLSNALGAEILPIAAIISAVYVFWLLTLAVILVEVYGKTRTEPKKLALSLAQNPLLLSVFIGLAIVWFQIELPDFLSKTINFFADSVTAVVLFSLGIFLGMQKIGNISEWSRVFVYSILTMIVLPFLLYAIVILFNLEIPYLKAVIIDAAMPLGLTPYALSVQYKLKTSLVARVVVLATLLSMVVIPLWMVLLN